MTEFDRQLTLAVTEAAPAPFTFVKLGIRNQFLQTVVVSPRYAKAGDLVLDEEYVNLRGYGTMQGLYMYDTIHVGYLIETVPHETFVEKLWMCLSKQDPKLRNYRVDHKQRLLYTDPVINVVSSSINDFVFLTPNIEPTIKELL